MAVIGNEPFIWLRAYKMFKNGILPNGGGWLDQPNKYVEIMCFIDDSMSKGEENGK